MNRARGQGGVVRHGGRRDGRGEKISTAIAMLSKRISAKKITRGGGAGLQQCRTPATEGCSFVPAHPACPLPLGQNCWDGQSLPSPPNGRWHAFTASLTSVSTEIICEYVKPLQYACANC